jgi:hypothetical protein
MHMRLKCFILIALTMLVPAAGLAQGRGGQTAQRQTQAAAPPATEPVSITCEKQQHTSRLYGAWGISVESG